MQKLLLFFLVSFIVPSGFAQTAKKTLYGSFVFERQVFQYQYKREGTIHSLKLSTLSQPNPTKDLDTAKLRKTTEFINEATKLDSSIKAKDSSAFLKNASDSTLAAISTLPAYLEQLKQIQAGRKLWGDHSKNIDNLLDIFSKYEIAKIKFADTLVKDIYSITELLSMYKGFLENNAEPQATREVPFPELKQEEFTSIFRDQLAQLYLKNGKSFDQLKARAEAKAVEVMYEIKARADFKDDEPVTAYMNLKRKFIDVNVEFKRESGKKWYQKAVKVPLSNIVVRCEVKNVIIEFEDGRIKNVFADLQPQVPGFTAVYGGTAIRFRNQKPIGITGKFDPDQFNRHKIYAGNTLELVNHLYELAKAQHPQAKFTKADFVPGKSLNAHFILSNLVDYLVVSETDNEDYSPTNSKIELSEPHSLVELKKEKRSKILSARAYTDFMGLSDDEPNGLVQIEVSKRINLVPGRGQGLFGMGSGNTRGIYWGGLTFIEPRFTLSKIEENNRYLSLDSFQIDKTKSFTDSNNHFQLNPLEVIRFQQWSFGADVNC